MDIEIKKIILTFQKYEITEHIIYRKLAEKTSGENKKVLLRISDDELGHYEILKKYSGIDIQPDKWMIFRYLMYSKILGKTFAIKLMERGEEKAKKNYEVLLDKIPETRSIIYDEEEHEKTLIQSFDEEIVRHIGSMVLGLNDALVELTGALVGFTFALKNVTQVGVAGLITGIAAALSMASSEYLSTKAEEGLNPLRSAFYTGIAYLIVVFFLVSPYFIFANYITAFIFTLVSVFMIILIFNLFVSVVKEVSFRRSFLEMIIICSTVSLISFFVGILLRNTLGINTN
ncbi:MAG: VIT1/CCC1 transporter family protein [Candidatus Aminicenantes bacterium]|nr:VIT1/CCC1 transporter family protein [Candidatus Aminicenantes bacterium]MCK5003514.1 VIT1/CCC1 transporter family protein [Candidatus Aminicenantes bacterium]